MFYPAKFSILQIPSGVPHPDDNTPVDLTNPADLIIYLVIPVVIVILYLVFIKRKKNISN
ncbi:MAG: adenylosuccinate synthetase [Bacteroidia bacterium]|nr:adenylosuccinate synthetase [Bacteroidia bacterium]NNF29990.1 adenylosuccinate synthetase [Flavobacteriaceae bacterium]MBT8276030.1 adenylosuccinate synthetase [Bacteroidia bacterium]NNJ83194.1 adenylosuccinate synthetase [Flavobacteriaceae bacterium]NNK53695.1 adenylosuccinate synthetase [Flavobacteriaceae bacterium]